MYKFDDGIQPDFSLVVPSRKRLGLLKLCVTTFVTCAANPDKIEFIILVDHDDYESHKISKQIIKFGINAKVIIRWRSHSCIRDYNNLGGLISSGKYIWILNDDVIMETDEWDKIILERAEEYLEDKPDRIFYGIPDDDTHSRTKDHVNLYGSCFPILSQETVRVQSCIMPKEISAHTADTKLYEIFKRLKYDRKLDLQDEIKLMHFCKHNKSREEDQTQAELVKTSQGCSHLTEEQYLHYINLLNNHIDKYVDQSNPT